ncbi:MAG: hypothetical protein M3O87_08230 [Candidatus Dormibacteraeota bacterium]|nr:hypothetical protein [Candidatus Dormibacteraeota bacterium]
MTVAVYNPQTLIGKVRLLGLDARAGINSQPADPVFQDEELQAFLDLNGQDPRLAAAMAIDTVATNLAFTMKWIKLQGLQMDGQRTQQALHAQAAELRRQVEEGSGDYTGFFDWAEMVSDPHSQVERFEKEFLRENAP